MDMRTIQIRVDHALAARVDERAKRLGTTRSEFVRQALRDALGRHDEAEMEERHKAGYRRIPPAPDEFAIPDEHRAWGDEEDTKAWVMPRSP